VFQAYGGSGSDLATSQANAKASIDTLTAKVKSEEAEKAQLIQEVADHKTDMHLRSCFR